MRIMNKLRALIKASAFDNMTLFKMSAKKQTKKIEKVFPILFTLFFFAINWALAEFIMKELILQDAQIILLTLFVLYTSVMTLIEGIYKSSGLLFNCKDDDLLLSLPIKKATVLFVRVAKFYVFELIYNALFLLPAMIVYAKYVDVGWDYFVTSFVAIFMLPIIPIIVSSIIGGIISSISSRFKFKTFVEIVITTGSLIAIFLLAMNFDKDVESLVEKGINIHERTIALYFPAKLFTKLITDFNLEDLFLFIISNVGTLAVCVFVLSKFYFRINSRIKIIRPNTRNKNYKVRTRGIVNSIIYKEIKRFISSPVYVTNSTFGLALFVLGCIVIASRFESISNTIAVQNNVFSYEQIISYLPVIIFAFICFTALMTSVTSSMISLEGKAFDILKSFPVKPFTIVWGKILASLVIIIPFMIMGDLILIFKLKLSMLETLTLLLASVVLPLFAETLGILVNLKYPRMDAENDTQVVKQSVSAMISVFIGMAFLACTIGIIYLCIKNNVPNMRIISITTLIYLILTTIMLIYLKTNSKKEFFKI